MSATPPRPDVEIDVNVWPWWRPIRKSDISGTAGGAVTASVQVAPTGVCRQLVGWSLVETTGAATASVRLWDGVNTKGSVFVRINLAANESTRDRSGPPGLQCVSGGIYLEVISGSVEGVIFWI